FFQAEDGIRDATVSGVQTCALPISLRLVCLPGLSTAPEISDVSGRGVGMEVVKTALETLGGNLEIASEPGVGTRIAMRLPLTVEIGRASCRERQSISGVAVSRNERT